MIEYKINSCNHDIKKFIKDIVINEFKIDYWNEWFDEQDYESIKEEPNILISALENNELIGICSIKKISDDECYMNSFYVKKEYRNKGIGKKLFDMCEEHAIKNKYKKIVLTVDPNFKTAIKMYEKYNYIYDKEKSVPIEYTYYKYL